MNLGCHDLEGVVANSIGVIILTRTDAALDADLGALLKVLGADLCKRPPSNNWNPVGLSNKTSVITSALVEASVDSYVEVSNTTTRWGASKFGILSHVSNTSEKIHLIYLHFYYLENGLFATNKASVSSPKILSWILFFQ